jgi:hypothetical protein
MEPTVRNPRIESAIGSEAARKLAFQQTIPRLVSCRPKFSRWERNLSEGRASYAQFEALLSDLHKNGFFPEISLISAVAHAMV